MLDYTNTSLHFKLLDQIGSEGKNSHVFIAHDYQLNAEIIVKRILKKSFQNPETFFNEAKILYSSSHPNIVPIQYSCQDEDSIYITMPVFKRGSLNQLINTRFLRPSEIIKFSIDFLSGLHHIHTKKLIHCDIKPSNILISNSNEAVLADFGLAKFLNPEGTATMDMFYHWHRAPETIDSDLISHLTDIYQAGLTIYRLCNGNELFNRQLSRFSNGTGSIDLPRLTTAIKAGKFPDRSFYMEHIPQKLRNYIRKAISPNPADRYDSVLDFLNDLATVEVNFDWQYNTLEKETRWSCVSDSKEYNVILVPNSSDKFSVYTTKRKIDAEKERQISDGCGKNISEDEAYRIIKFVLRNNSL